MLLSLCQFRSVCDKRTKMMDVLHSAVMVMNTDLQTYQVQTHTVFITEAV